jgi:acyl carrier protein
MKSKLEIREIILSKLKDLNDTFDESQKFTIEENMVLFGNGSSIDSLSLVSLIVDLETEFSEFFGEEISLTDDRAMTRPVSPFTNIRSLTDYVDELTSK